MTLKLLQSMVYGEASTALPKKNCWCACHDCKTKWHDIEPPMTAETPIHFYRLMNAEVKTEGSSTITKTANARRFICDSCHQGRVKNQNQ